MPFELSDRARVSYAASLEQRAEENREGEAQRLAGARQVRINSLIGQAGGLVIANQVKRQVRGNKAIIDTGWAPFRYDVSNRSSLQVGLTGSFEHARWPRNPKLEKVTMLLRGADLDGAVHGNKVDEVALFDNEGGRIGVPEEPESRSTEYMAQTVEPDTDDWFQLVIALNCIKYFPNVRD
jgi:hypothetical protein